MEALQTRLAQWRRRRSRRRHGGRPAHGGGATGAGTPTTGADALGPRHAPERRGRRPHGLELRLRTGPDGTGRAHDRARRRTLWPGRPRRSVQGGLQGFHRDAPAVDLVVPPAGRHDAQPALVASGLVAAVAVHAPATAPAAASPATGPPVVRPRRGGDLRREASGFAAAGALGLLVDIGGYNVLVHLTGWLADQPLLAKTLSLVAGTTVAYFGNRYWTYRDRPRGRFAREYTLYLALSGVALGIALGCLAFSRYVLGQASPVADNIAANGVGLALGSLFRFLSYRRFVFPPAPPA